MLLVYVLKNKVLIYFEEYLFWSYSKRHQVQFCTTYQHSSGSWRMRVTTLGGPWHNDPQNMQPVGRSFDQEAAAVLMARVAGK